MSKYFERSPRIFFVFRHNKNIESCTYDELICKIRKCVMVPMAFSIFSLTTLAMLQRLRVKSHPIVEVRFMYTNLVISLLAGIVPGTYMYVTLVFKADELFWQGVDKGIFGENEIRIVQDELFYLETLKSLNKIKKN